MERPFVVVGGGLAGLVCARWLYRNGAEVIVIEADDRVGGRLKTDTVDGFILDRGFQIYLDAYPHTENELNEAALHLCKFEPGAVVMWGGKQYELNRESLIESLMSPIFGIGDKIRLAGIGQELAAMTDDEIWQLPDIAANDYVQTLGLSAAAIERFVRPFFGGIFLDRQLPVSARMFAFVWKYLSLGSGCVPAKGMEEIPRQVAADLPQKAIRTSCRVTQLNRVGDRVTGVTLADGEVIQAEAVIVATEAAVASQLTGIAIETAGRHAVTVAFDAGDRPVDDAILVLNGDRPGYVNHLAVMSKVAPGRAPAGRQLIVATLLGDSSMPDDQLANTVRYELQSWFPKLDVMNWRPLRVDRMRGAQLAMEPGFDALRPKSNPGIPGLYLAGEYTTNGSIDGAVLSGYQAAYAVLADFSPSAVIA